jgi:hypothetical protein
MGGIRICIKTLRIQNTDNKQEFMHVDKCRNENEEDERKCVACLSVRDPDPDPLVRGTDPDLYPSLFS